MSSNYVPKVHTNYATGHERALCGVNPNRGLHDVRRLESFFDSAEACQCQRCLDYLERRGYSIAALRQRFTVAGRIPAQLTKGNS